MPDEQPSFIQNDQELLEAARSIDPKVLSHFRLLEQPFRGGPDFRYLFTTDQVQEVLIQSVQLSLSRTGPFTLTGAYGTGGIRLTRDSWNTTIVTQNAREGHPWWSWFREPEALKLQPVPPYVDTRNG